MGSIYARAREVAALYAAGWRVAECLCCWVPPWRSNEDDGEPEFWDEDEALARIGA